MTPAMFRRVMLYILRLLARDVHKLVYAARASSDSDDLARALLVAALLPIVRRAAKQAWVTGAVFLVAQARSQGVRGPISIPGPNGYSEQALQTVIKNMWVSKRDDSGRMPSPQDQKDDAEKVAAKVEARIETHIENTARRVIHDAPDSPHTAIIELTPEEKEPLTQAGVDTHDLEDQLDGGPRPDGTGQEPSGQKQRPIAWARRLTGAENCVFCIMLASRGAIYHYEGSAISKVNNRREHASHPQKIGDRYHDHCDCIAVPVYDVDKWDGKTDADALYDLWKKSQARSVNDFRSYLADMAAHGKKLPSKTIF